MSSNRSNKTCQPKTCTVCGVVFRPKGWTRPGEWSRRAQCSRKCTNIARGVPIAERLAKHSSTDTATGCINYTLHKNGKGYGYISAVELGKPQMTTHRAAYILANGPIPDGLHVLHRCDNPSCINPMHLFLGTNDDNNADKVAKGRARGAVGERNPKAKLTRHQVRAIRADHRIQSKIAADYGVSQSMISAIKRGVNWGEA